MSASGLWPVAVVLLALAGGGLVARRLDQSPTPAYIVAGIALGVLDGVSVGGVGLDLGGTAFVGVFADLGLVLLLFFLGLHVEVTDLLADRRNLAAVGALDLVVNVAVGAGVAFAVGLSPLAALFVGGMAYSSSSAIVTKVMLSQGWVATPESAPLFGTLVVEDVVIAVYIAVLAVLATAGTTPLTALASVGQAMVALCVVSVAGWYATGLIDRHLLVDSDEHTVLRVLGVTALVAAVAVGAGLSEGVTAFFVGAAFGQTGSDDRLERLLEPVRDLFAAVFFLSIGMGTDLAALWRLAVPLAAVAAVTGLAKVASGWVSGRRYGLDRRRSFRVGLALLPRGEFALVLAALAAGAAAPSLGAVPAFAVGYVLLTSVGGTVLLHHERALAALVPARVSGSTTTPPPGD